MCNALLKEQIFDIELFKRELPPLYTNENTPLEDVVFKIKFFCNYIGWSWYASEFDGVDTFFGYVEGYENEWGYFSLNEFLGVIASTTDLQAIQQDLFFTPITYKELLAKNC